MILYFLFIFLFFAVLSLLIFFIFSILIPAMKSEGIKVESPIFSLEEKNHTEKLYSPPSQSQILRAVIPQTGPKKSRMQFEGAKSCSIFYNSFENLFFDDEKLDSQISNDFFSNSSQKKCFGFGDCQSSCPLGAIFVIKNGENQSIKISENCDGCGKCLSACPLSLITLEKNEHFEKKHFKFWRFCYKIFLWAGVK